MHGAAHADARYTVQTIARLGDVMGSVRSDPSGYFQVGALNDAGQLVFIARDAAGGEMLVRSADGKLEPLVLSGGPLASEWWGR
jgi:hypothetical protein